MRRSKWKNKKEMAIICLSFDSGSKVCENNIPNLPYIWIKPAIFRLQNIRSAFDPEKLALNASVIIQTGTIYPNFICLNPEYWFLKIYI